ncbi:hypothetical protein PR202_gb24516 [Eleusine coracana subsp. coracana]|uniref:Sugar phosphate transporter domain-containing protein n=1 Tax=Eleusine coracana subsp. coracana TaxID=191504 RepID=A0AAV5FIU8_ELECO|nr:hypothetical protein PR202_gb24516 [Eleusine coracana subsp. coracana]
MAAVGALPGAAAASRPYAPNRLRLRATPSLALAASIPHGARLFCGSQLHPAPALATTSVSLSPPARRQLLLVPQAAAAADSGSAGEVKPKGFAERYPTLVTGFFFFLWYFFNVIFNILNKKIFDYFPYPYEPSFGRGDILPYWLEIRSPKACAVSFAHTIKALEPFFNAAASQFVLGQPVPLPLWLSLLPVVIGVSVASLTELSFNWTGFINAMISNISFTYRSIYSKKAMTDMDSTNLYAYISIIALIVCIPPAIIIEGPQLVQHGFKDAIAKVGLTKFVSNFLLVGLFYHLYNQVNNVVEYRLHAISCSY